MDCKQFQPYVELFTHRELVTTETVEAHEHLTTCPSCTALVTDLTSLKEVLTGIHGDIEAPPYLRRRILESLEAEVVEQPPNSVSFQTAATGRTWSISKFRVPLGIAAVLALTVGVWQLNPWNGWETRSAAVAGGILFDVGAQHRLCAAHCDQGHGDPLLVRDPDLLADHLGKLLGMEVIVPDLSATGFKLIGADCCGVKGRRAAHALYQSDSTNMPLSLFSLARITSLPPGTAETVNGKPCFASADGSLRVVGWHEGSQTYFVCSELPETSMLDLVGRVRSASAFHPGSAGNFGVVLATVAGR